MKKALKKKKSTGPTRMRELGKIASQLWYTPEQYDLVKRAAQLDKRPMTTFAILATLEAATLLLKNAPRLAELGLLGGKCRHDKQN